ncbi:MAG: response regulator transcription factor [Clostridia bacterium]|nr:response regulator transcription factor [Clostridia bacterium]
MLKIDICDDEQLWIDKAREIVGAFFKGKQEIELNFFDNSKALINKIVNKKEYPDIVILDIDMPEMNGFETAKLLKDTYPDILLLFYTVHEQYVFEAFQFQPFRYIRKSYVETELKLAFEAAWHMIENRHEKYITLKTFNETINVKISEIVYFETNKRRCDVHLVGKTINVRKTIKELYSEIDNPEFVMIHSGAVVNVRHIKSYSSYDITLESDERLVVGRNHIKSVKSALAKYWGNRI